MLTSVAYTPGRAPATQQQCASVCLPHTTFTLYAKICVAAAALAPSFSRNGCVSGSALECVCLAISTSRMVKRMMRGMHASAVPPAQQCLEVDNFEKAFLSIRATAMHGSNGLGSWIREPQTF